MEDDSQPPERSTPARTCGDAGDGQPGTSDWRRHGALWIHPSLVALLGPEDPALGTTTTALAEAARAVRWDELAWSPTIGVGVAGSALHSQLDAPPADLDIGVHLLLRATGKRAQRARALGRGLAATIRACSAALARGDVTVAGAETSASALERRSWTPNDLAEVEVPGSRAERDWHKALERSRGTTVLYLPTAFDLPCPIEVEFHHSVFFDDGRYRLEPSAFACATGRAVFERASLHAYGSLMSARRRALGPDAATPAEILSEFQRAARAHGSAARWSKVARIELASLAYRGEQHALQALVRRPRFVAALELASLATRLATLAQHPRRDELLPGWARAIQVRLDARGSRHGFDRRLDSGWRAALADLARGESTDSKLQAFAQPALARANRSLERALRR